MATAAAANMLEAEFRALAQEARSKEGLAGFFSSTADQQAVKDAAERVILKVRSCGEAPDAMDQIKTHYQEILRPLQLSLDTKSDRLKSRALAIAQNLIANHALPAEASEAVVAMLSKVDRNTDENVQLKTLQTALTLLQSPLRPHTEEQIGAVLAVCLRLTNKKGHKDAVLTTAAATVRQAVALVLSYVDVEAELQEQQLAAARCAAEEEEAGEQTHPNGAASAAQKLVEDLCNIASGAPPLWLKSPSLPRTFVLELLDFLLANSPAVFRQLPPFQNALAVRMTQLIQAQLQDHLDAGAAGASFATNNFSTFRALLRLTRTLLRNFYPLLGPRSGTLVQALLAGLAPRYPLYQRIALMQLVHQLLADPLLMHHLFATYDLSAERKLHAVQALCQAAGDVVDAMLKSVNKDPEDDPPLEVLAGLYSDKTAGKDWALDTDFEAASQQVQRGYLSMLAIDSLLAFMCSVEKLVDMAVDQGGAVPAASNKGPGSVEHVSTDVCKAMVDRTWRPLLTAISQLLQRSSGEEIVLQLLKGYQVFTQACGNLPLLEPRDAFLANLCDFALSTAAEAAIGETGTSPRGAPGHQPAAEKLASPRGSVAASAGEAASEPGLVLAPKNVQSMRTLFNIAHRLSNVLGPAWVLVLETMNTLDRILHSPSTTTQEVSAQSDETAMPSDLVILAAAASQLFECTRDMSREAVVSLLSGLRDVSMRNIPAAGAAVGQAPKLFALNRMVEVLLYNINRIYDLWAIFLSHVLEVINDPKPPVRAAAIEALGRAITGALGSLSATSRAAPAASAVSSGDSEGAATDSTGGVEHMLLVALEALFNADKERDVRAGVLRVLLNVLQRHGERLSDGWTPVFRLLAAVPAADEADAIDVAFQSLQLTCSDYMTAMPFARLKRCLEVTVLFSRQQADVNVSLTTISLLWNAADLFGKAAPASRMASVRPGSAGPTSGSTAAAGEDESDTEVEAAVTMPLPADAEDESEEGVEEEEESVSPSAKRGQLAANLTPAQTEELLQMIFLALQGVSQDLRPEVRNSGVRTLFAVVVNQGPRLSRALWEQCLWEMLFPLLRHAYLMSATASRDEAESMLLGQSRGKEIRMMVHHSRNSEQKQWDETVVIALGGMARLLRAHLPAIVGMDRVAAGWEEMMVVVESSMAGGRKEVALAAITLLSAVLQAHGAITDIVTLAMWKRAVRALDVGVEAATSPSCMVPLTARTELLALIGLLYTTLRSRFDAEDTAQVFLWVEKFSRNPWSDDDAINSAQVVMGMPPVQKAALAMLPKLAPTHLPQLYPEYIYSIVRLLRPEHVIEQWQEQQREAAEKAAAAGAAQHQFSIPAEPQALPPGASSPQPLAGMDATDLANCGGGSMTSHGSGTVKQPPGQVAQARFALTSAFLEKVIEQLVTVYRDAPLGVRATTFASVVSGLGRCMEVRYIVYHESLWRVSAQAFNIVVPAGLPALAAAAAAGEDTAASWEALADAFETFLLGANVVVAGQPGSRAYESSMASDVSMVRPGSASSSADSSAHPSNQGQEATSGRLADGGANAGAGVQATPAVALAGAAAPTPLSPQQARQDAELEVAVLDCLTDAVLTQCAAATAEMKQRLIGTVDAGASRPKELSVPQATTSSNFAHVCIRKMYVLCSRGGGGSGAVADLEGCLLEVSRLALPMFMARCDAVLRCYAEDQARTAAPPQCGSGVSAGARTRLDEVLCILEVLASMTLVPAVADAALPPSEFLTQMVRNLRSRPEVHARGRERTHLLLLYSSLCGCITCKEPRVREMVRDVLLLAGAELGLGVPLPALPVSRPVSRQLSLASSAAGAGAGRLSSVDESDALL